MDARQIPSREDVGLVPFSRGEVEHFEEIGAWGHQTLWDCFADNASATPDRLALADDARREAFTDSAPRRLTYGEALSAASGLAGVMTEYGLRPGDLIYTFLPNVIEQALVFLAAARLGVIVSPLLVNFGEKEIGDIYKRAPPRAIFTTTKFGKHSLIERLARGLPPTNQCPVLAWGPLSQDAVDLEQAMARIRGNTGHDTKTAPRVSANAIATVCWTSGTEGAPKGVARTHNNWLTTGRGITEGGGLQAGDVLLNPFPFVNMASIGGLFSTWLKTGGTFILHIPFDLDAFLDQVAREQVTYSMVAPALLKRIADSDDFHRGKLGTLRALGTGSAPADGAVLARYEKDLGIAITNFFGSNEGVSLIAGPDDCPDPYERAVCFPRVGRPEFTWRVANANWCCTRLTDPESGEEITQPGVPGLMRMKGPSLFPGYFSNGTLDRKAFDAEGYYVSGDLFQIESAENSADRYRFVGRHRDIIIRGGMNIAPAELDTLLMEHPKLIEGAVASYPDAVLGERVCACVTLRAGETITLSDITGYFLDRGLARFKLPERIVVMDALPRNALNKIRREVLRDLISSAPAKEH